MTQEALKLALYALENHTAIKHPQQIHYRDKAITAIKKALAQTQEPVAYLCEPDENGLFGLPTSDKACKNCFPVYRHPQRTWVGLTRDDVLDIEKTTKHPLEFYRAIEAKLKERNA